MADIYEKRVSCESRLEIMEAMNAIVRQLPPEDKKRFNAMRMRYLDFGGNKSLFEYANNRTVAEILADYSPDDDPKPICSGEVDGVRYTLYDAPKTTDSSKSEPKGDA